MRRWTIILASAIALVACQGTPNHSFVQVDWPTKPVGADKAEGAIIWLHGWCPGWQDCTGMGIPEHIKRFGKAAWDIYRMNVPPSHANHDKAGWYARARLHANLTLPRAKELRDNGYKRVVLAGYSGGATSVLFAGTMTRDVDAILAVAPCCGVNVRGPYVPTAGFYRLLKNFEAPRLMIVFFSGEQNAPSNIGSQSDRILRNKEVIYRIIDQPNGFDGHLAGLTTSFANVFGDEIIAFMAGAE